MTIEKAVIRTSVFNELGAKADDFLEAYKYELKELEGALQGMTRSQSAVEGLFVHVDKEIDELKMDLETGKHVKTWLVRAANAVNSLRASATNHVFVTKGKIEAMQRQIEFIKRAYDLEKARLEAYTQAQPSANVIPIGGDGRARPTSLKHRRAQEQEPAPEPAKKKRGRKPKAEQVEAAPEGPKAPPEESEETPEQPETDQARSPEQSA